MFEDIKKRSGTPAGGRFGGSLAVALAIYGAAGAVLIGASATARHAVEEKLTQVTFAVAPPAPEPPPPPPVVEARAQAEPLRPKAKRAALKPPTELPRDKPKESDQPLATAEPSGPVDGFLDGVEGGRGAAAAPPPPPPPPPATVAPPIAWKTNARPSYSTRARIERVEGTVVVSFEVLENGQVAEARVVSGPRELHESVLKTVTSWRFTPAHRGATPVRFKKTQSIVFRLEDA